MSHHVNFTNIREEAGISPLLQAKLAFIRESVSYRQVFERYGWNWQSESTHQMSCVFHGKYKHANGQPYERNPSARYYAEVRRIYCFACAEGGDVVWFVRKKEGLRLKEAIQAISTAFDITDMRPDIQAQAQEIKKANDESPLREMLLRHYSDLVNDGLFLLQEKRPAAREALDRITIAIFRRRREIERNRVDYVEFSKQISEWHRWAVDSTMTTWNRWHMENQL